ncbi:MAG: molecular chaperone HtpG [Bacteroidetes bacterium GWA2_31_9]|nr:MAG: molecular chaperone HtpG [Bacteroidetes bacterium GWA2_31_9]
MSKGNIGVTTENIFPIIKKYLYSDHDIFLRELVSNAVDATQKLKTLSSIGEFKGELGDLKVVISLDKKKKTLTISDNGIGMSEDEVNRYINQIAFSSANEFLEKYKKENASIIGHFGLGFYSSFMVSEKVEINTKSYKEDEKAVKWVCDGSPEYSMTDSKKETRGTEIILHIDEESKDFLEESKISELLKKYSRFLPIPICFGKESEYIDEKWVDTDKDKVINNTAPLWVKKPSELKEEDYKNFYDELYPYSEAPLFNIHLNVDYPFNLTGVLYFPKIKSNFDIQKNKIQLYCNQVFVTDSVEGIVPDFLTLLHGVIDSPDIPLNVSRSYLQSDSNVKKLSAHIAKKVSDRLLEIFKNDRKQFEEKWDDLKLFIQYGVVSDEKFFDKAKDFFLFKNLDGKYFTFDEYKELIKANQTDKHNNIVHLYSTDKVKQYSFIEAAKSKGYDVLIMDGQLDMHFLNNIENKLEKCVFTRVDSDVIEKLIKKEEDIKSTFTPDQEDDLRHVILSQVPKDSTFFVSFEGLSETGNPMIITQSEYMRRMKEMSAYGGQMGMYRDLPENYNLVVNTNHPLIKRMLTEKDSEIGDKINEFNNKINPLKTEKENLQKANEKKKDEEIPQADKDKISDLDKHIQKINEDKKTNLQIYGKENKIVKQVIDLALLSNNMLTGEDLTKFVKRSVELIG